MERAPPTPAPPCSDTVAIRRVRLGDGSRFPAQPATAWAVACTAISRSGRPGPARPMAVGCGAHATPASATTCHIRACSPPDM